MRTVALLSRKLLDLLSGRYSTIQLLQRINRTPLRHLIKAAVTLTYLGAKARRRQYARRLTVTNEVRELRDSGICRPQIDPALLKELSDSARGRWNGIGEQHRRSNKTYLRAFIAGDLDAGRIDNRSIFIRFAAQPSLVELVAAYFGEAPYLSYVALDLSEYAGEVLSTSQLWHRDHDDTKVVKLFVYLTDVASGLDGPFTFIRPQASRRISGVTATHLRMTQYRRPCLRRPSSA